MLVSTLRIRNFVWAQSNKIAIKKSMRISDYVLQPVSLRLPCQLSTLSPSLSAAMKFISLRIHLISLHSNQLRFSPPPAHFLLHRYFERHTKMSKLLLLLRNCVCVCGCLYQNWKRSVWVISFARIVGEHRVQQEVEKKTKKTGKTRKRYNNKRQTGENAKW